MAAPNKLDEGLTKAMPAEAVADPRNNMFKRDKRKCQDICMLISFFVFWVGMLAIAGVGLKSGDPYRLIYGQGTAPVTPPTPLLCEIHL